MGILKKRAKRRLLSGDARGEEDKRLLNRLWTINIRNTLYFSTFVLLVLFLKAFKVDQSKPLFVEFLPWEYLVANSLMLLVLLIAIYFYLRFRKPHLLTNPRLRLFAMLLLLGVALLGKATDLLSPYLIPVAMGTGLATIFLGAETGFVMMLVLTFLAGMGAPFSALVALVALGGGMTALLSTLRLQKISQLIWAGVFIGLVNMLMYAVGALGTGVEALTWQSLKSLMKTMIWAGLNGPASALLILGGIPVSEYITQKTSSLGLLELLNPSQPLLRMLRERAPGTYHHSECVANLAESAAQAIGADPLLAKVGGYYHDIGKMRRPEFFVENQNSALENPHETISPSMSKVIIASHIKEGMELGREYGLKEDVLQFIPQHHGRSVIRYFYLKALREGAKDSVINMADYRYEAELPKTKETAILMLADSVEAASRTLEDSSRIEDLVEEMVREKLFDGQLNEGPLTMADLAKIKEAFCETLHAMRHARPEPYVKHA